jgi:hypothetical protein
MSEAMHSWSVNSVNFKITFEDGHTQFISKGKSKKAVALYQGKMSDLLKEHGAMTNEVIISYLCWDKDEPKGSPSVRAKANAFGRPVEPGHSFKALPPTGCVMDKGVYVPQHFKPFRKQAEVVEYGSVAPEPIEDDTPYTEADGQEPDQA